MQRKIVGGMLDDLDAKHPGIKAVMLAALQNVHPSHLLDASLWQSLGLEAAVGLGEGDGPDSSGGAFVALERLARGAASRDAFFAE